MAKLYVDPKRDVEKLIRSFCRSYGAGSNEMFAAVQFLRGEIAVNRRCLKAAMFRMG
jgi:hypothetical protein